MLCLLVFAINKVYIMQHICSSLESYNIIISMFYNMIINQITWYALTIQTRCNNKQSSVLIYSRVNKNLIHVVTNLYVYLVMFKERNEDEWQRQSLLSKTHMRTPRTHSHTDICIYIYIYIYIYICIST